MSPSWWRPCAVPWGWESRLPSRAPGAGRAQRWRVCCGGWWLSGMAGPENRPLCRLVVSAPAEQVVGLPVNPATEAPAQPITPAQPAMAGNQADPCPIRLSVNRELPTPFTCVCSAQKMQEGAVWGTDTYTDDSRLCRAAVHAGAIPAAGGAGDGVAGGGAAPFHRQPPQRHPEQRLRAPTATASDLSAQPSAAGPEPCHSG